MPIITYLFYVLVFILVAAPLAFILSIWHEALERNWRWINEQSRSMYVDGFKTMVTASGIAVALLASSTVSSARTTNSLVAFSAKAAVICLISCVCLSLIAIVALLRGFERARSRYMEEPNAGSQTSVTEGKLNNVELLFILCPSCAALICFLVGFAFLGRIAFHF